MFQQDLQEAKLVEISAIPYLLRFTPSRAWLNDKPFEFDNDIWWQWKGKDLPAGVEVKYDRLAPQTHRVAIEHRSIGKSTCEFAVYCIAGNFWLLPMFELKAMIGKYPVVRGGDYEYELTLVPEREFVRQAFYLK